MQMEGDLGGKPKREEVCLLNGDLRKKRNNLRTGKRVKET